MAEAYARFECDAEAVLANPALVDVRQPPTARFVDAFAEAVALATERYPARAFARRFIEAVEREERAWAAAVGAAERSRDARFSPDERDLLDQTRRLLSVVESSEYEHERHAALRQALRKLRDLERRTGWQLPSPAALALEKRARGILAASTPLPNGKGNLSPDWVTSPAHGESASGRSLAVSVPTWLWGTGQGLLGSARGRVFLASVPSRWRGTRHERDDV